MAGTTLGLSKRGTSIKNGGVNCPATRTRRYPVTCISCGGISGEGTSQENAGGGVRLQTIINVHIHLLSFVISAHLFLLSDEKCIDSVSLPLQ